jgi:hypothetical protein
MSAEELKCLGTDPSVQASAEHDYTVGQYV